MNPPLPDDESAGAMSYRMSELEKKVDKLERHIDTRFDGLAGTIGSLQFVRNDLYQSERDAMKADIKGVRALSWACFSLVATGAVAALFTLALKAAAG